MCTTTVGSTGGIRLVVTGGCVGVPVYTRVTHERTGTNWKGQQRAQASGLTVC
jgi:hypothetical protein